MKKTIVTAILYTLTTALVLGIAYPLTITGLSRLFLRDKADGQLITRNGEVIGSKLIGQPFTGAGYFHSRPSAAGTGYDAGTSSGSNLAPSSKAFAERVSANIKSEGNGSADVPIDLVTTSGSGLDPDITPAAALYQVTRVAHARHMSADALTALVEANTQQRQLGLLGEPRVNVLQLNLALDDSK